MKRHAIVHIGPMKTGSTSIQHWLHASSDQLEEAGFHVVASLGRNMSRLSAMVMARVMGEAPIPSDGERLRKLGEEINGLPASARTLVFSAEMLGQHLHREVEVAAFKTILDAFCDGYTIVTYLRRQDELSVSRYSTALRRGERRARPLSRAIDYEAMLGAWSQVFGRNAMRVRIFDRSAMVDGDVVQDFAEIAGLPFTPIGDGPIEQNPSLVPEAQHFLLTLAERAREEGHDQPLGDTPAFERINSILNQTFTGKGMKPSRADALAFYETVRASNERVRQTWFPERETLFKEDFSSYPITAATPPAQDVLGVAITVLARLVASQRDIAGGEESELKRALNEKMRHRRRGREPGARRGGRRQGANEP